MMTVFIEGNYVSEVSLLLIRILVFPKSDALANIMSDNVRRTVTIKVCPCIIYQRRFAVCASLKIKIKIKNIYD